jgi:hypothetical protein
MEATMQSENKNKQAIAILGVAAAMGLLADALLRGAGLGINLTLWIGCLIGGLFIAKRIGGARLEFGSAMLMAPMILFAGCFAWRDSETLQALDLAAIVVAAALVITRQTAPLWVPSLTRVAGSVLNLGAHCVAGFAHLVARDIDWTQQRSSAVAANARGAAAGVVIAIPFLLVATALFVRADARFENFVNGLTQINLARHAIPIALGTWVAGSYLRGVLVPPQSSPPLIRPEDAPGARWELGAVELNVALGLVNALFATFVALQLPYLFGDTRTIELTPGLTYAGYARRGFFELVTVALLVLPMLLAGDKLHAPTSSKRLFRAQSLLLVAFVFGIMASALLRMRLYQQEFGLTELRFYTTAFMLWLAVVFVLFSATVLRNLRGLFAMGTVAAGFAGILVLHAANPDSWIAEANLANAKAGRRFDVEYFKFLSADAAPTVLANLRELPEEARERYLTQLRARVENAVDWRSWNYGRHAAAAALEE